MSNTHDILQSLVKTAKCKPGWSFQLRSENFKLQAEDEPKQIDCSLRLVITINCYDSSRPNDKIPFIVSHFFPVPYATYNRQSWRRWIFEMCRRVENHELGEWFRIENPETGQTERPFQPLHGPGEDPYTIHEFRPEADALTTQDGSMRDRYK